MKTIQITFAIFCAFLTMAVCHAVADPPQPASDLYKALNDAATGHKLAFILLGRSTCGNCNATRSMIRCGKIPITDDAYVMADLNVDDARTEAAFMHRFGRVRFGDTLPFVVVTDAHGKVLASSGGYKNAQQWTDLLTQAKTKADASADPGATDSDWPFPSPTP